MIFIENLRAKKWVSVFIIYLRYLIGGSFVFASIVKIQGNRFTTESGIDQPINSWHHLFETLYQSGMYWEFLGWSQLISGFILMTQRYAALGALLFFPITINIFFITLSYPFGGTPIITGLILLANIALLLWDYKKFTPLFQYKTIKAGTLVQAKDNISNNTLWTFLGLLLFSTTIIYVIIYDRKPIQWFIICLSLGLAGLILYNIRHRQKNKNGR